MSAAPVYLPKLLTDAVKLRHDVHITRPVPTQIILRVEWSNGDRSEHVWAQDAIDGWVHVGTQSISGTRARIKRELHDLAMRS